MQVYVLQLNGIVRPIGYTSLRDLCKRNSLPYGSASKGKRIFVKGEDIFIINKISVFTIKGRENNHKGKRKP